MQLSFSLVEVFEVALLLDEAFSLGSFVNLVTAAA
jgi:hypothetical protein